MPKKQIKKITLKDLRDYAIANRYVEFDICNSSTWLAASCASSLVGKRMVMASYCDFIDDSVTIPASYGEMCEHFTYNKGNERPECSLTGEELAKMIEDLEDYAL